MLTKSDLKEISKIVKQGNDALRTEFRSENEKLGKTLRTEFRSENEKLRKEMRTGFARLDRKLDKMVNFLDRDYLRLLERVERIEDHLNLQSI